MHTIMNQTFYNIIDVDAYWQDFREFQPNFFIGKNSYRNNNLPQDIRQLQEIKIDKICCHFEDNNIIITIGT